MMITNRRGIVSFALILLFLVPSLVSAKPVEQLTALKVAKKWLAQSHANLSALGVRPFKSPDGETLAYIVDLDPKGYIVIPADDLVEPILCYGTESSFSGEFGPGEVLSDILIRDIPQRLHNQGKLKPDHKQKVVERWSTLKDEAAYATAVSPSYAATAVTRAVGPLIQTNWGQGDQAAPFTYELYTPNNYYTGCVATAMAMIMHYYRYPSAASATGGITVDNTWQSVSFNDTYNYDLMPAQITNSSPSSQIQEVAKLMRDCGYSVNMMYSPTGSASYTSQVANSLVNTFKYASARYYYAASDWTTVLKNELNERRPVEMTISSTSTYYSHAIVCDGWGSEGGLDRFHLNMGWDGYTNGWYSLPNFTAGYTWDALEGFVCDIRPGNEQQATASAPINQTISPNAGSIAYGSKITFTTTLSDANGSRDLSRFFFLINTTASGKGAYLKYDCNTNKLYLRNDASTSWLGGYSPGAANTIENSYCKLYCAETTKTESGNTLTVDWKISPKSGLSANTYGLWLYVYDDGELHDGWDKLGTFTIGAAANQAPVNISLSPNSGSLQSNTKLAYTTVHSDANGYGDITNAYLMLNTTLSTTNSIYVRYDRAANKLYLRNSSDTGWLGGYAPGSSYTIENSFCKLYCSSTTRSGSGNNLTVKWSILLKSVTAGKTCYGWTSVYDKAGAKDGWDRLGTFSVK